MSKKRFHRNHGRPNEPRRAQPAPVGPVQAGTADASAQPGDDQGDTAAFVAGSDDALSNGPAAGFAADTGAHAPPAAEAADAPAAVPAVPEAPPRDPRADIRGVLIQVAGARLLLPNATIAEVLSYADPDPIGGEAPDWLLGRMRWRGWHLPLIAFGRLAGVAEEKAGLGNKVVVLKALAGNAKTPYIAMLTQGFPRLVTVAHEALRLDGAVDPQALPRGIQARVFLNEDEALLPDLDALEVLVADAVAQAA